MDELLQLAKGAARRAGEELRRRFAEPRTGVGTKSSATDMVTDSDRVAEKLVMDVIATARPDDAVLGEESGLLEGSSGIRWIVDPLDGTTNFLFGVPQFSVSIACEDGDGTLVGVVYDVPRDELFSGIRGAGAFCNQARIHVSAQRSLADALIATGYSYDATEREVQARMHERVLPRVRDIRRFGSAALDLCWVACGRFDGYYEAPCHPWDGAAGELIVREAGGLTVPMAAVGPSGPGWYACAPGIFDALCVLVEESRALAIAR